jgi:hypothetical protein
MSNTYDLYTKDFVISFAYYIKTADGYDFGETKQMIIEDCYFDYQAEEKFFELTGEDYEGICVMDIHEVDLTTEDEIRFMEKTAMLEHLFGTTDFGQTDHALELKYSDYE